MRMRSHQMNHRWQAGDTIVEVLICIGVIALVLTGAFAISNRSSNTVQDSSEHAQASMVLQSQVESLRAYLHDGTATALDSHSNPYCMPSGGGNPTPINGSNNCNTPDSGGAVYKPSFTVNGDVYQFSVTWDTVGGGTGSEKYTYRDYIGS